MSAKSIAFESGGVALHSQKADLYVGGEQFSAELTQHRACGPQSKIIHSIRQAGGGQWYQASEVASVRRTAM